MNVQENSESSDDSEYELVHRTDVDGVLAPSTRSWSWRSVMVLVFLLIPYFLCNVAYSSISPFFPKEAERHGVSTIMIGVIISSAPLSVAILSPLVGYILSRVSVWPLVFTGLMLVGSSYTSLGFVIYISTAHSWIFILSCVLLRIIEGVGTAMFMTATFSTIPQLFPNSVATIMGLYEVAGAVGYCTGPLLGGVFYQLGGFRLPFLAIGCSVLLFIIPCTLMVRNMSTCVEDQSKKESLPFKAILRCYTDVTFIALSLVFIIVYNTLAFYAPSLQLFITNEFHQNALQVGLIYSITAMSYAVSAFFVGPLSDRLGHRLIIILGVLFAAVGHFIIGLQFIMDFLDLWFIRAGLMISGLACAMSSVPVYPELLKISKRYIREDVSEKAIAGVVSGWISCTINIGQCMWPLLGGLMANFYPLPMNALLASEVILAEAMLLIGVTIIDKYMSRYS